MNRANNPLNRIIIAFVFLQIICSENTYGQFREPPTMNQPQDIILLRNSGQQNVLFTGISDNDFFFETITLQGFSSDNTIINQGNFTFGFSQGSSQANFYFTPEPNRSGLATIEIRLTDPDGSTSYFFDVLINNPPSFNLSPSHTSDENDGPQSVPDFAYNISDGDDNDGSQTLTFDIKLDQIVSGNLTFTTFPSINNSGTLIYHVGGSTYGEAILLVTLDDGQDGNNISAPQSFRIFVDEYFNTPPTFTLSGDIQELEDFTETLSVTVTPDPVPDDELGQEVTYSIEPTSVILADINFDPQTGNVLINSVPDRFGQQTFTITADDGEPENNTHSEKFTLTITNVDDPPTMDDVPNISLPEGAGEQQVLLTGLSAGPYETQMISSIIASSFNPSNIPDPTVNYTPPDTQGTLVFTPDATATGETTIQIFIVDQGGKTLTKTFLVTIEDQNHPPSFDPVPSPIILDEDAGEQSVNITGINAGAGENQSLSFDVVSDNQGLINDVVIDYTSPATEGTLIFSLNPNAHGLAILSITLTDDGDTGGLNENRYSQDVEVIVNPVNDPPEFISNPILSATTGLIYSYEIIANDPDNNDVMTISATSIPNWLDFSDNGNGNATLTGTPQESDIGNHSIELLVQDNTGATDVQDFSIQVSNPNNLPIFTSTPLTKAVEKVYYEYQINVEDPDSSDEITIIAVSKPNWLILTDHGNKSGMLEGTPPQGSSGVYDIILRATDSKNGYTDQIFSLNVSPFNEPPRLRTLQQVTNEDQPIVYNVNLFKSNFIDDDGDSLHSILIKTFPQKGKLFLSGIEIETIDTLLLNEIKNLRYVPDNNYYGLDYFNWNASDGIDFALNDALASITINDELDPPSLTNLETYPLNYPFGQDSVVLTNNIEVFEVDNGRLESATITISENFIPGVDSLSASAFGNTRITFDGTKGILLIEGIDSVHVYQQVLRSSTYYNRRNLNPNSALSKSIRFRVRDVAQFSNELTRIINFEDDFVDLDIPNGFTPNDDLANDTWNIGNIELYPEAEVRVFARNGDKVFESFGYQNEWDGQSLNGRELPAGVYYYFINLNKYSATYRGTITILK